MKYTFEDYLRLDIKNSLNNIIASGQFPSHHLIFPRSQTFHNLLVKDYNIIMKIAQEDNETRKISYSWLYSWELYMYYLTNSEIYQIVEFTCISEDKKKINVKNLATYFENYLQGLLTTEDGRLKSLEYTTYFEGLWIADIINLDNSFESETCYLILWSKKNKPISSLRDLVKIFAEVNSEILEDFGTLKLTFHDYHPKKIEAIHLINKLVFYPLFTLSVNKFINLEKIVFLNFESIYYKHKFLFFVNNKKFTIFDWIYELVNTTFISPWSIPIHVNNDSISNSSTKDKENLLNAAQGLIEFNWTGAGLLKHLDNKSFSSTWNLFSVIFEKPLAYIKKNTWSRSSWINS